MRLDETVRQFRTGGRRQLSAVTHALTQALQRAQTLHGEREASPRATGLDEDLEQVLHWREQLGPDVEPTAGAWAEDGDGS
jgi:hypothetical protein